ncbi:MAG: CapA family protein [Patescibacteria group bacterium]|jgi:poly-gamma-glutamate synthesis protein (capsule biosynthesis protein)
MEKYPKHLIIISALLALAGVLAVLVFYQFPGGGRSESPERKQAELSTAGGDGEEPQIAEEVDKAVEEELPEKASLVFVGDIMLDRNVYLKARAKGDYGFAFKKAGSIFSGADFPIANLEGPITDNKSVSLEKDRMVFTFSPEYLPVLKKYFSAFSLANNHTLNFGQKGLATSRQYLEESGMEYFGDPSNDEENLSTVIEKNGFKIGLAGYHSLYRDEPEKIVREIEKLRPNCDLVVIFPHWGIEYARKPSKTQANDARKFIDAGADLIIGTHPHVIQTVEVYKGKYVFYSLGNFIFDQYFSKETMEGLAIRLDLIRTGGELKMYYRILPVTISKESQAELAGEERRRETLDWLAANSEVSETVREEIKTGALKGELSVN